MRTVVATAATALLIVAPWLVWTPLAGGAVAILLGAIAILAACHGCGRMVARIAAVDTVDTALAIQWGIAAIIAIGGWLIAFDAYDARLLVIAGTALHTTDTAVRFTTWRDAVDERLRIDAMRWWWLPATLVSVLGIILVLAGAGAIDDRMFDEETSITAQLARLRDTGGLADAVGFPRISQLGGRLAIEGLVTAFADVRSVRLIESLGLLLVLVLACGRIGLRDAAGVVWSSLLVVAGSAFALAWPDLLPLWVPVGLLVATSLSLDDARTDVRGLVPVALTASALATVRFEMAAIGLAFVLGAWWLGRRDARRAGIAILIVLLAVGGYVVARTLAWSDVDMFARTVIEPRRGSIAVRIVLSIVVGAAVIPLVCLALPRWHGYSIGAGIGGIAGKLGAERIYGARMLWVLAISALVLLVVHVARRRVLDRRAFAIIVVLALFAWEGRAAPGRIGWSWRYYELMFDVEYARHAAMPGGEYNDMLRMVPRGDRVAVWLTRPERIDYAIHDIVDLRTPRFARLRVAGAPDQRMARVIKATRARWLLVERDDARIARARGNLVLDVLCRDREEAVPPCADTLELAAAQYRAVATRGNLQLFALR